MTPASPPPHLLSHPPVDRALARCIGSVRFDDVDDVTPLHVPARDNDLAPLDLLPPTRVTELLASGGLRAPFFRMVDGGTHIPRTSLTRTVTVSSTRVEGIAEPGRIWEAFRSGATLVLESLHRSVPPITDLCTSLALELGHPVQANAYVTPPGGTGFAPHVDTHDVLVVQTHGRKQWEVRERSAVLPHPVGADRGRLSDAVVTRGESRLSPRLDPGDCLYIPRGFPHSAQANDGDVSIHVTIGLLRPTLRDLAREALRTTDDDELRASTSLRALRDDPAHGKRLRGMAERALDDRALRELAARQLVRSLPATAVPPMATLAGAAPTGPLALGAAAVLLDHDAHTVVLPDRDLEVDASRWHAAVELLEAAHTHTLRAETCTGERLELVTELVAQGVLVAA